DPPGERECGATLRLRRTIGPRHEIAAEAGQRPASFLRIDLRREERLEILPGSVELSRPDTCREAQLERSAVQLARIGIALLEAVEQLGDRRVIGRAGGRGDDRT